MYRRLRAHAGVWDMIVVGGGATGAGVAIDAASRGSTYPPRQIQFALKLMF
jgi:glycerol-3-phosphate dehydrogenase